MTDSGFCDNGDHLKNVYVIVLLERSQKKKKKIVSVRRDMKLKALYTSFEISLRSNSSCLQFRYFSV